MPDHACFATRTRFHHRQFRPAVLALAVASAFTVQPVKLQAQTLPTGGVAVHGQAAISNPSPNQLRVVTQNGAGTNHSAINWQSFSIAPGASTNFVQPSANSLSINRVVTNTPSSIFGALSSNGRLVLVNQSGIAVGAGAVIDTAGFTASALRMSDADALAGRLRFGDANAGMGGAAGITVGGRITARDGDVVLVAPNIGIGGTALVQAPNGSTILAAGQQVEITGRGLEGITMLVQAPSNQVRNLGRLEGDAVGIFAGTLRHSGEIQATAAVVDGGKVVLTAAGRLEVDGKVSARGSQDRGGVVHATGDTILLADAARIDVGATAGGGEVLVGGGWHGADARIRNAQATVVAPGAQIHADAGERGDGGAVVVWADRATRFAGAISARGGVQGGNGGRVEVSGKQYLDFRGSVDVSGPAGAFGTLLLDPATITIVANPALADINGDATLGDDLFVFLLTLSEFPGANSVISAGQVATQLGLGNVFLQASGNIDVQAPISYTAGVARSLDFDAGGNFSASQPISSSGGPLGVAVTAGGGISVSAPITTRGGAVSLTAAGGVGIAVTDIVTRGVDSAGLTNATDGGAVSLTSGAGGIAVGSIDSRGGFGAAPISPGGGLAGGHGGSVSIVLGSGSLTLSGATVDSSGGFGGNATLAGLPGGNGGSGGNITVQATAGSLALGASGNNFVARGGDGGDAVLGPTTGSGGLPGAPGTISLGLNSGGNGLVFSGNLNLDSFPGFSGLDNLGAGGPSASFNAALFKAGSGGIVQTGGIVTGQNIDVDSVGAVLVANPGNVFSAVTGNVSGGSLTLSGIGYVGGSPLTALGNIALSSTGNVTLGADIVSTSGGVAVTAASINGFGSLVTGLGPISIDVAGPLVLNNQFSTSATVSITAGGAISQSGGFISAGGLTTINAGSNSVNLSQPGNNFNSIAGSTGALTVVDINSLDVDFAGINSNNGNVTLSATGSGAITLSGPVNAGTGQINISSGADILGGGALTGSNIAIQTQAGLDLSTNITATGTLLLATTAGSGITQSGGSIVVGGLTTATAGSLPITLTQPGNDFSSFAATGTAISVRDANALNLGAINGATSLNVQTNGNLTQSAPLVISGTTSVTSAGNVTLTTPGNNLNSLSVAGNAIDVVEGAGNSLVITSLTSGLNQPVRLVAGHTLTLPGTPINTGSGDLSLASNIGPLVVSQPLNGHNIDLHGAGGLTVNASVSALSNINLSVSTDNATSISSDVNALAGSTSVNTPGGLEVLAGNQSAGLRAASGQSIDAKYVTVLTSGTGTAEIFNTSGPQTIVTHGMDGFGQGLSVTNVSGGAGSARIRNNVGAQSITVNDAALVRVNSVSGPVEISSGGNQTIVIQGASSGNYLQLGHPGSTHGAEIRGNNQSITVGLPGQSAQTDVLAGVTNDTGSGFGNDSGTQTITTSGRLTVAGGSAPGGAGTDCLTAGGGTHVGACGYIGQDGTGLQKISALQLQLLGGTSGSNNLAVIGSQSAAQLIEVTGGGNLALLGGSGSGSGNRALVAAAGPSQTVNFLTGGTLSVVGGTVGSQHSAGVLSGAAASTQTFTGATGIQLSGGSSGGGVGVGNFASLRAAGSQSITVGNGGISMVGGGGALTGNYANIEQIGGAGTSQSITINGTGSITLQGGSSAGTGVAGGSEASILSGGDSQSILFTGTGIGRAIDITGGTVGADAYAEIYAGAGSQSIVGAGLITLTGGASGGGASFGGDDTLGNLAIIAADINHQTITASGLVLQGGAGGLNNFALVYGGGNQAITVGASGLQLLGGGGGALDAKNAALVLKGDDVPATSQTITVGGGGAIVLQGGNASASNVGLDANLRNFSNGAFAAIRSEGVAQLIEFAAPGGSIQLTGGTLGSDNHAMIVAQSGTQTIRGSSAANAPGLALSGGASGGVGGAANEGNRALLFSLAGNQSVTASSISLAGGAAGNENLALIRQGDASNGLASTQAMTIVGGGSVAMQGGGGNTNFARIRSFGATQSLTYSAGGSLNLTGGTGASLDFASIDAVNGNQNILGSPNIAVTGGASGGADLNGNFAIIIANSATATQTIVSSAMALQAGAGGTNNFAVLMAPVQNITVHGNLAMTGGGSATSLDGTTGGGTLIGANGGAPGSAVTLVVDNHITLTGGSVGGAAIGNSIQGGTTTSINITAGGNVTLNPGTVATAGVRLGSPVANTAAGDIVVVAGGAITLNGTVAGETSVRSLGKVKLEGNTLAIGNAVTGSEVDLHGLAGVSLSGVAAVLATATSGNSLDVVVDGGAFSNTAGAGALNAVAGGRWLVYSVNPVNDTRGGLVPAFKQYGAVSGSTVLGTGNGFLYSVVPSATASLVGPITKAYDGSLVATLTGANYSVTGIDGDVVVLNSPSTGIFDTKDFGTGKTVTSGASSVVSASNGAATVFGYNPLVAPATGAVGSIGAASLVLTTSAVTKIYDGTTSALGSATISSGALVGSDTLGGGSFAFVDPNAGANKAVTVNGVTVNDGNGGANYSVSYVNNATSTINPFAVNLTGSRSYDGTTAVNAAVLNVGALVGTQTLNLSGVGTMATKHVGTGKALGLGTLALVDGSGLASNYTFTGGTQAVNITQAPLTLSATNVTKTYDGGVSAAGVATVVGGTATGGTGTGGTATGGTAVGGTLFAGDTLGTSGLAFADKNVGIGNKTVTVSAGAVIDGNSGANYNLTVVDNTTSTINPFVVNLTGNRDYNGLATVGAGALVTGTLAGSETLTLSGAGSISGKNVGNAYPVALGTLALADGSNGGLASNYTLAGGTRTVDISRLASVAWTGSVDNLWSTPGNWVGGAVPDGANVAAVVINSGSGDITHDVTGVNINSLSSTRRVVQSTGSFGTAALPAQLVVTTAGGVALDNPGNRIATLSVSNSGSGEVSVQNTGVLNVAGLTNTAGGIKLVNTGAITTTGAVRAAVGNISITANSPLSVGSSGVTADVGSVSLSANNSDGNMTLDGPITAGTAVLLDAGATLTQNSAVVGPTGITANAGVGPMVFGPSATTNGAPINYMVNNVAVPAPPKDLFKQTQAQAEAVDTLVTFLDLFEAAVEEQVAEESLGTNSDDTKKKKKAEDTIVTEGEVCR